MSSDRNARWVLGIPAVFGVFWLLHKTWPMQVLFLYIALFTGIDIQSLWDQPARWHVKQTMTVETPRGEVTSSVVRAKVMVKDRLFGTSPTSESGEALAIEIAPGRFLFAVIEENKPDELRLLSFPDDPSVWDSIRTLPEFEGKPLDVPRDQYPLMVTFGDLKDPKSVQQVDPFNLPATFGPGYRIKSYRVEITDEPVTDGSLNKLLPWAAALKGSIGKDLDLPYSHLLNRINDGSFIQGSRP